MTPWLIYLAGVVSGVALVVVSVFALVVLGWRRCREMPLTEDVWPG